MDRVIALGWKPEGRKDRHRQKTTSRKTVEKARNKAGRKSWKSAMAEEWRRDREVLKTTKATPRTMSMRKI